MLTGQVNLGEVAVSAALGAAGAGVGLVGGIAGYSAANQALLSGTVTAEGQAIVDFGRWMNETLSRGGICRRPR